MEKCFSAADILLPDFNKVDTKKWAVVACDQFTSEPEYWEKAAVEVGSAPSTLNMILPEVYLGETEKRVPAINETMHVYIRDVLVSHGDSMIYVERTQSDGSVRHGIILAVDLEKYEYTKGASSLIRATEATVIERIPPRVAIRRGAETELPHVMLLVDDPEKTVIEPLAVSNDMTPEYDFELMLGGGHIKGSFIGKSEQKRIEDALLSLVTDEKMAQRYGKEGIAPLLFAVGDGNHSLASAKAAYEEVKSKLGADVAAVHPSRYALCEVVNIHDDALKFEPIYRVVFGVEQESFLAELREYAKKLSGEAEAQTVEYLYGDGSCGKIVFEHPVQQLTVGTLQTFIDAYIKEHKGVEVDYIHGEGSVASLSKKDGAIGFIFSGMEKSQLFKTVIFDGALPRKTFSMGHAEDKRYYLECRKIDLDKVNG
ncbi:MAG: DUF1015 domain-containing protein [Clostridia bacterium]|nr:DUF1015 domain-containing protein [Clostridia bacterium]